ncbi:enoyl-CoA hydratase/carnithine racemase [Bradyrhizobium liaoningense]|nr:hypothetical protein GCM10007858_05790 [Bradyrhizobium liaoningense]
MMVTDYVKIEKGLGPEGRIAVVRFDRGDGINALSPEALRQLTAAARSFEDDAATSVVVLTGSSGAFCAGFDRAGPGCLDSAPLDLSGFLPGYAERGALRFCRCVGRA